MRAPRTNTVSPRRIAAIGPHSGLSDRVRAALTEVDAKVSYVKTMRQLRLASERRAPDLVVFEVAEVTADRLTAEIDLLRGMGVHAPLFVVSNGIIPGDGPVLIGDVVDFATAQATTDEIVMRVGRALGQVKAAAVAPAPVTPKPRETISGIEIDWRLKEAKSGDTRVKFSNAELLMLEALLSHMEQMVTTGALLRAVWGDDRHRSESLVPVYVLRLRRKLARLGGNLSIETTVGAGYKLINVRGKPAKAKKRRSSGRSTRRSA